MLSDLQTRKLTRYFHMYDVDDDGHIGPRDFARILENLRILHGLAESSEDYRELEAGYRRRWEGIRRAADADHDGEVSLDEWLDYWDGVLSDEDRYEEEVQELTERLFSLFDTDGDGSIQADEFCNFYGAYGMSAAQARQIFMDLDADGDSRIARAELLEMSDQFYRSNDPGAAGNRLFGPLA